jgi:transcriptional regulator with XRE-family HTH domain
MVELNMGTVLKLARLRRGLSQPELASRMQCQRTYISKIERGRVSTQTMTCRVCKEEKRQRRGQICQSCHCRTICPDKKYFWTPDIDAALRRTYQAKNRVGVGRGLTELVRRTGWPRRVFIRRAGELGFRVLRCKRWEQRELNLLREQAGTLPMTKIGAILKRSPTAIRQKLLLMGLSGRVTNGYTRKDLGEQMGVRHSQVDAWLRRGWLKLDSRGLIDEGTIQRFLWDHMDEYRFHSCDEHWLKTMLNPNLGSITLRGTHERDADERQERAA